MNKCVKILCLGVLLVGSTSFFGPVLGCTENISFCTLDGDDGRIYGYVETYGRCIQIPVPDLTLTCFSKMGAMQKTMTNDAGFYEFNGLSYVEGGTIYVVWISVGQGAYFGGIKIFRLTVDVVEKNVNFFVPIIGRSFGLFSG